MSKETTKCKKILLVQTANSNLGDNVIADNHAFLIRKIAGRSDIKIYHYSIASRDVGQIKFVDAVVFAGGILKITNEKFFLYIPEIIRAAQAANVPVYLSSIGVEHFYADDPKSIELKEALNLPCVKGVAVRDDIETFKSEYLTDKSKAEVYPVYDVAVWSARTYKDILPDLKNRKPLIGVGIVRHKLFADYGHPEITKEIQMDFWLGVIRELESRGMEWAIFTNGDRNDEAMAREVLETVGHGRKLDTPLDSQSLIKTIAQFTGVIAGRMHSNIVSFSMGIPSIGIIWNQKLRFWGAKIGHPERFMETDEIDSAKAVNLLVDAMKHRCGPSRKMLKAVYKPLKAFIKKQVQPRGAGDQAPKLSPLCANHLGSIRTRYPGTNSIEALVDSVKDGYKNFRADLRLTSDGVCVCVQRWNPYVFKILGYDGYDQDNPNLGIDFETFKSLKYYDRFPTVSFEELWDYINNNYSSPLTFMLSYGRPGEDNMNGILTQVSEVFKNYPDSIHKVIFCAERKKDFEQIRQMLPGTELMYYYVPNDNEKEDAKLFRKNYNKALDFAREAGIQYMAIGSSVFKPDLIKEIHRAGFRSCVFTDDSIDMILKACNSGSDMVLNNTYPPAYIKDLLG
ncbi:MAG: polysaccharide pyruvyl transferase family protein [Lachnospiraceae bacterium]|nr:polysaccharide pyruvyl transferase family protein [Lachnospiraceae bacterium]